MIGHRCSACIWWDNREQWVRDVPPELGKTQPGFCRKHKPGAMRVGKYFYGVQPVTDAEEFCGEFRAQQ